MNTLDRIIGVMATPWVVRAVLVLTLLATTLGVLFIAEGDIAFVSRFDPEDERVRFEKVKVVADQIQERIDADPSAYTPENYFADMVEISKEKRYRGIHYVSQGSLISKPYERNDERHEILMKNLVERRFTNVDIDSARERILTPYLVSIGEFTVEGDTKPPIELIDTTWMIFLKWIFRQYLKLMPFAFVLYLVWIRVGERSEGKYGEAMEDTEWRKRVNTRLRNFGSLAIALIFYPFVLAYVWKKELSEEFRRYEAEAELRRQKRKLFTLLSDDELALIAGWVKRGLSRIEIRKELEARGHTPQHSYAIALIATFVLSLVVGFIPKASASDCGKIVCSVTANAATPSSDARAGPDTHDHVQHDVALPSGLVFTPPSWSEIRFAQEEAPPRMRPPRAVEHVPIFSSAFWFGLITN